MTIMYIIETDMARKGLNIKTRTACKELKIKD